MRWLTAIFFLVPFFGHNQNYFSDHFGGTVGIVANVGTHVTSVGLKVNAYYADYFYQINAGSSFTIHQSGYGNRTRFIENRNNVGLILLAGKRSDDIDFQFDGLNHQTGKPYGVGYNYLFYFDNARTSQRSGGFALHINNFSLYHENDVFAGQAKDRFRTGHLMASYRYDQFKFGMGVNLWTGETANSTWQRIELDKCPSGFRALEDLPYGKTSHGIGYVSVSYSPMHGQYVHLKAGVDSEEIRHKFQNRLIHDMIFLPKKVKRTTPHYPRLDEYGCPVFNDEDKRKTKLYLQLGMNDNWSN